jgi:hypothetical protein
MPDMARLVPTRRSGRRKATLPRQIYPAAGLNPSRGLALSESMVRWLALLPPLAILIGPFFLNRVTPYVLGMPFLLAWLVIWILLTAAIMAVIFRFDPANREEGQ